MHHKHLHSQYCASAPHANPAIILTPCLAQHMSHCFQACLAAHARAAPSATEQALKSRPWWFASALLELLALLLLLRLPSLSQFPVCDGGCVGATCT